MNQRCLMILALAIFLAGCSAPLSQRPVEKQNTGIAAGEPRITPDVVYGHKFGMALTFDMFQPQKQKGGASGVLCELKLWPCANWLCSIAPRRCMICELRRATDWKR
jgi:hypothetical protein